MITKLKLFSTLLLALVFAASTVSAEDTITPTEVERIKDYYYFKMHGGPYTPTLEYGKAEFVYKNLSGGTQNIYVCVEHKRLGTCDIWPYNRTLVSGEEWSPTPTPEDFGATVNFKLYIDDDLAFESVIWVPPTP